MTALTPCGSCGMPADDCTLRHRSMSEPCCPLCDHDPVEPLAVEDVDPGLLTPHRLLP